MPYFIGNCQYIPAVPIVTGAEIIESWIGLAEPVLESGRP